nr:reverse transcriptase domain-containing protein [Tanacetum cinerariifolium]
MRTRSSSNLPVVSSNPSTSYPKRHNRRRSKQPFILEESLIDTMVDQRTMAELLRAPTEGYVEAIVVPSILAEQFELKHSLINMMTSDQFFGLEKDNPHDHIRWFNKITSTKKYKDVPNFAIRLMLFMFSLAGFDESFHEAWDRYKDRLRACPHHGFTELYQLDTFHNALNSADQDSLNAAAGGNLLERRTQDVLTIIENKSKVQNSGNKSVVSKVKSCDANSNSSSEIAKFTHAVNQQTSAVTTAMTAIIKQFQATPPPASVKAVEEICFTCGGAHLYYQCLAAGGNTFSKLWDNIQGYVLAATVNYNQGNSVYHPPGSGSLPSNTVSNPKGELKAITTRSGLVLDGPTIPTPPLFINPEEDERVEETLTNPDLSEYTIKLHVNITLADALILMPNGYLEEVTQKLRDLGKFLIPCGFSELKCKALADLAGIARDVFVLVGKFTFPADFVIVDYESDLRVPLILGRPFLSTARALISIHGEEMILRYGDERLTLNMRHDTSSYSNQPQKESINLINVFNNSSEYFLEDLFSNQPCGNPTFPSHPKLTSLEVKNDIFDLEGGNVLPKKLLDLDSTKDLHPPLQVNPLSGSTTYSSSPNPLLEELVDELALIIFPLKYDDDLQFDDDPFDSKGEKIKESKLLIDELDLPCDFLPSSEYDSFPSKDFSRVDALTSTNNEDK